MSLTAEPARRLRLIELGLVPGRRLRVVIRGATGGLVVAVGDTRIALDAQTSAGLVVAAA